SLPSRILPVRSYPFPARTLSLLPALSLLRLPCGKRVSSVLHWSAPYHHAPFSRPHIPARRLLCTVRGSTCWHHGNQAWGFLLPAQNIYRLSTGHIHWS